MRVYQTSEIKNIALLGSAGSGKTTLADIHGMLRHSILFAILPGPERPVLDFVSRGGKG